MERKLMEKETAGRNKPERPESMPLRRRIRLMIGLLVLLLLVGINLAIYLHILQFNKVISGSMEPTLMVGDIIFSDANAIPERYDIVCLSDPEVAGDRLVKRIMGVPGDVLKIEGGVIYLNGKDEYSEKIRGNSISWPDTRIKVPREKVFLLGDNRNNSHDSLNFGPVSYANVRGVVKFIVWPPSRMGRPKPLHGA